MVSFVIVFLFFPSPPFIQYLAFFCFYFLQPDGDVRLAFKYIFLVRVRPTRWHWRPSYLLILVTFLPIDGATYILGKS